MSRRSASGAPAVLASLALILAVSAAIEHRPWAISGQEPSFESHANLPLVLRGFAGSFPDVPTPRGTPRPTRTDRPPLPTATEGPTPTPTLTGEYIDHPTGQQIVLQIGWNWTVQVSQVWLEMEGTPWFTLYGNGRLITGHKLLNREQPLFETQVTEYDIQRWLRRLANDVNLFGMNEAYDHPQGTAPIMHVYVRTDAGYKRVTIRGWRLWADRDPPSVPGAFNVKRLVAFIQDLESEMTASVTEPYQPQEYTILAQQLRPPIYPNAPQWNHPIIDVTRVADAAPLAVPSPIDRLVGHMFADGALGKQIWDLVVPVADQYFPQDNRVAQFTANGRPIAVGARQEVPGRSPFLPDYDSEGWYRSDIDPPETPFVFGTHIRFSWDTDWSADF